MNSFRLELVTEHQHKEEKAVKLGQQIASHLGINFISAKRYSKFDSSYRISLKGNVPEELNHIEFGIRITSSIVDGWITKYDFDSNKLELIFNKSPYSRFTKQIYNGIIWGQFVMD